MRIQTLRYPAGPLPDVDDRWINTAFLVSVQPYRDTLCIVTMRGGQQYYVSEHYDAFINRLENILEV